MPKINLSLINGYESMSVEDKLKALENFEYEIPTPDYSGYVSKETFDKTASELAAAKKANKESHTTAEQQIADIRGQFETQLADMTTQLKALQLANDDMKKEKDIASLTAEYVKLGYGDLAEETAKADYSGDRATVFKNQALVYDAKIKQEKENTLSDLTKGTPVPPSDNNNKDGQDDLGIAAFKKALTMYG